MGKQSTSTIGFEKQIWDAACVLRGNIDASEYKSVVLGLIFLKYISDSFDAKYQELLAEGEGYEEGSVLLPLEVIAETAFQCRIPAWRLYQG